MNSLWIGFRSLSHLRSTQYLATSNAIGSKSTNGLLVLRNILRGI